jgi:hypothetical protein
VNVELGRCLGFTHTPGDVKTEPPPRDPQARTRRPATRQTAHRPFSERQDRTWPLTLEQKVAKVTEFHELALDHADVLTEQLAELHAENQDLRLVNARLSAALISLIEARGVR